MTRLTAILAVVLLACSAAAAHLFMDVGAAISLVTLAC
jgi:hypothetical protein